MESTFIYRDGTLVPGGAEIDPAKSGYRLLAEYGDQAFQAAIVWRKQETFLVYLNIDDMDLETVHIDGVPDFLRFVREYMLPLIQAQQYVVVEEKVYPEPPAGQGFVYFGPPQDDPYLR